MESQDVIAAEADQFFSQKKFKEALAKYKQILIYDYKTIHITEIAKNKSQFNDDEIEKVSEQFFTLSMDSSLVYEKNSKYYKPIGLCYFYLDQYCNSLRYLSKLNDSDDEVNEYLDKVFEL